MMHGYEQSDPVILAMKPTNKAGQPVAEPVEPRAGTEGTAGRQSTLRAQNRKRVTQALDRVRQAAKARKKGTVHHAPPPYQHRPAAVGVLRPQARRRPWHRRSEMAGLRVRPRAQSRGSARASPPGSIPGTAVPATVHSEAGWPATPPAVAALEDKIVQRATIAVLNAIYEEDFLGFSYGFRPKRSQHDALDALVVGITSKKVNWILDADIRSFFDSVSQEWLIRFVEHRVGDPRIIRLIQKWLKAGILEDGGVTVRHGDGAGLGDLTTPRQRLPALCPRPLGAALATARGHGRCGDREVRR
jgi:RNA-directed DNA polymerase